MEAPPPPPKVSHLGYLETYQKPVLAFSDDYLQGVQDAYEKEDLAPARQLLQHLSNLYVTRAIANKPSLNTRVVSFVTKLAMGPLRQEVQKCNQVILPLIQNVDNPLTIICKGGVRLKTRAESLILNSDYFAALFGQTTMRTEIRKDAKGHLTLNLANHVDANDFDNYLEYLKNKEHLTSLNPIALAKLFAFANFIQDQALSQKCKETLSLAILKKTIYPSNLDNMLHVFSTSLIDEELISEMSMKAIDHYFSEKRFTTRKMLDGILISVNAAGLIPDDDSTLGKALRHYVTGFVIPFAFKPDQIETLQLISKDVRHSCKTLVFEYVNCKGNEVDQKLKRYKELFPNAGIVINKTVEDVNIELIRISKASGWGNEIVEITFRDKEFDTVISDLNSYIATRDLTGSLLVQVKTDYKNKYLFPEEVPLIFVDKDFNIIDYLDDNNPSYKQQMKLNVRGMYMWDREHLNGALRFI